MVVSWSGYVLDGGPSVSQPQLTRSPVPDRSAGVQDECRRGPHDTEPADQVEIRLGVDIHVHDTVVGVRNVRQDLAGGAARLAKGGRELDERGALAKWRA
jgi:hypothetical protein